jgi:hypothetical protein
VETPASPRVRGELSQKGPQVGRSFERGELSQKGPQVGRSLERGELSQKGPQVGRSLERGELSQKGPHVGRPLESSCPLATAVVSDADTIAPELRSMKAAATMVNETNRRLRSQPREDMVIPPTSWGYMLVTATHGSALGSDTLRVIVHFDRLTPAASRVELDATGHARVPEGRPIRPWRTLLPLNPGATRPSCKPAPTKVSWTSWCPPCLR